jgi:hypothetical protein
MKKDETLPKRITFFIEPDGTVTISNLFADVLPIAFSLNPSDQLVRRFLFSVGAIPQLRPKSSAEACPQQNTNGSSRLRPGETV